jgi:hypothetical protein
LSTRRKTGSPKTAIGNTSAGRLRTPQQRKEAFLAALAKTGNVTVAARMAKIDRGTHYDWLKEDPEYKAASEDAIEQAADVLEEEAVRRAVKGVKRPVYQGGELVGYVQEYSDTLLIFLLKGNKPAKFRERYEHSGTGGSPIQIVISETDAKL